MKYIYRRNLLKTDIAKILGMIIIGGFFAFQAAGFYSTEDNQIEIEIEGTDFFDVSAVLTGPGGLYSQIEIDSQIEIEIETIEIDLDVIKNLDVIQTDLNDTLTNLDDTFKDLDDILGNLEDILIHLDTLVDLEHVDEP